VLSGNSSTNLTIDFGYCQQGGQGCTPGYWKQCQHFDSWPSGLTPSTKFSSAATGFENAFPNNTLLQVLNLNGTSKLGQLGFHTVAALLSSKKVNYAFTSAQVVNMFNSVYPGTDADYEALKNIFAAENERGCPLNREGVADDDLAQSYTLMQNFPNPFNPTTEIYFQMPNDSKVTLKIYNTLGQEVRTLVDEQLAAGVYGYMWDARDNNGSTVSSGIYFYRLTAGEYVSMRKMSLLK
jgi:hypothetical protein